MTRLLMRGGIPVAILALVYSATWWARRMAYIPDAVAYWLWPALIAAGFLFLGILALLRHARIWIWPLGAGFAVQTVGIFLLMARVFESSWEPLWYTLGAVALVLAIMGGIWLSSGLRARGLERRMATGMAEGVPGNEAELGRIRKDMMQALAMLRRAGRGRNAIYELPWFLVMGRPAAGKTVAIKNSGLGLPVKKDWVKGVGGTFTCDWFFTNDLVFLDTPGKWVTEGADEGGRKEWDQLLRLLKRYRGRRPLDGLVVVVPADDLLNNEAAELEEQAAHIRDVVDKFHANLDFRFPVYILVSKTDLVEGFVDFFRSLPAQRRHEILGWSNEAPGRRDPVKALYTGLRSVQRRLETYRLEMLGRIARRSQARKLFFFTEEFKALERPLGIFVDAFFQSDRYHEPPVFRGFYFTSGTQEGSPVSKAMAALARTLGVPVAKEKEPGSEEPKRSYFLLDLFRDVMVGDEGLVGRTAGHWWRQRRNTFLGAFAPAGLAVLILLLSLVSFLWNRGIYSETAVRSPEIVASLDELGGELPPERVLAALEETGRLRTYHRKMASFSPLRSLGMRRPGAMADSTRELFRQQFVGGVLRPTLSEAEAFAADPEMTCTDRIDVLHSVVWLRMGRRAQWSADLAGFDTVWGLRETEAEQARDELLRQYVYFKSTFDDPSAADLLPGFSIRDVALSIRDDCASQGSTSAYAMYVLFQDQCAGATTNAEVVGCAERMNGVLNYQQDDYEKFVKHFDALKADLAELEIDEPEAKEGLELLRSIRLVAATGTGDTDGNTKCLKQFADSILPSMREYAIQDAMLEECRERVRTATGRGSRYKIRAEVLKEQEQLLVEPEQALLGIVSDYNITCSGAQGRRLDYEVLKKIASSDRRVRCLPEEQPVLAKTTAPAPRPVKRATASKPRRKAPSTEWLVAASSVSGEYGPARWAERHAEWSGLMEALDVGYDDAQRSLRENQIRQEVASYAAAYLKRWTQYLGGLELRPRKPAVTEWIAQLATTPEYAKLLRPAAEAVSIAADAAAPPFDVMQQKLRPIEGLVAFVASDLSEYQGMLREVGADLERCMGDSRQFLQYRNEVVSGEKRNSLVRTRDWVSRKAGPTLANNALQEMLQQPLKEAEGFVRSDNLLKTQWTDLRRLYDEAIRDQAPFGGGPEAEPVSEATLKAFLGGETGAVIRVRNAAGQGALSTGAESWLKRAEALSEVFFEPGSDALRAIRPRLEIGEPTYEPPSAGKSRRVRQIRIYFGEDANFGWNEEQDEKMKRLTLPLFGDTASDFSYVRGVLSAKKGFIGRAIGANWQDEAEVVEAKAKGFWAPLTLISQGLAGGNPGSDSDLQYTFDFALTGKKSAKVTLPIKLSSAELPLLLDLLKNGLEPPPGSVIGG